MVDVKGNGYIDVMSLGDFRDGMLMGSGATGTETEDFVNPILLKQIQGTNNEIKEMLLANEDMDEFLQTNEKVYNTFDKLQSRLEKKLKHLPIRDVALEGFLGSLQEFQELLIRLSETGRMTRFLTSTRLRKRLEKMNSTITQELYLISGRKKTKSSRNLSFMEDDQAKAFWDSEFGLENPQIEWNIFLEGLVNVLQVEIDSYASDCLKQVLDNSQTGLVSLYKFSEFLKGFGPLKECVEKTVAVLKEDWFYYFITREEAKKLLFGEPDGTFLVRFSKTKPGSFALAFNHKRHITVMIESCMPIGLKIQEEGDKERIFPNIFGVIDTYKKYLTRVFESPLPLKTKESWFHGDISFEEVKDLLSNQKIGTYLIRFGEGLGEFVASYVSEFENTPIQEINIKQVGKRFKCTENGIEKTYESLLAFIHAHRNVFKYNYDSEGVPTLKIKKKLNDKIKNSIEGPTDIQKGETNISGRAFGTCYSAYPPSPGGWWPLCDAFAVDLASKYSLVIVTDGCNWGYRPQTAAHVARRAIKEYVHSHIDEVLDTKQAGHMLLESFSAAHNAIIKGNEEDFMSVGTTTALAGLVLDLNEGNNEHDPKVGFVLASVGDCKAFLWHKKTENITDITAGNRAGTDPTDPGGRLGPYINDGDPDLRNLCMNFILCEEGDVVLVGSDGLYDNLDPEYLGKKPFELGFENVNEKEWSELSPDKSERIRSQFIVTEMAKICKLNKPKDFAEKLVQNAVQVNQASISFMENERGKKLPSDYKLYPGKMDHTTCTGLQIKAKGRSRISSPKSPKSPRSPRVPRH